jgi:hypothetical protein
MNILLFGIYSPFNLQSINLPLINFNKEIYMKKFTIYGIALILGSIGGTFTMIVHPTGADVHPSNQNALHGIQLAILVHSLAISCLPLQFLGFLGLSRIFDLKRPIVSAALIIYGLGVVAVMCAAVLDGFGATSLAKEMLAADESNKIVLQTLFRYNLHLGLTFAKVFLVGSSVAIIIWSVCLFKFDKFGKILGGSGCVIASLCLLMFLLGHLQTDRYGFAILVFAQSFWTILLAIWMIKFNPNDLEAN